MSTIWFEKSGRGHLLERARAFITNNMVCQHFVEIKGRRMGRSDKVSLWYVSLLINTRFHFFILE